MLSHSPTKIFVSAEQRLNFLKDALGESQSVRLILTDALEFSPEARRDGLKVPGEGRAPRVLAHSLTIERHGRGFIAQVVAADPTGEIAVGESVITHKGKIVQQPGRIIDTDTRYRPFDDRQITGHRSFDVYRDVSAHTLIDRLAFAFDLGTTLDVRAKVPGQGLTMRKAHLDQALADASSAPGQPGGYSAKRVAQGFSSGTAEMLQSLASHREEKVRFAEKLMSEGLAAFSFQSR